MWLFVVPKIGGTAFWRMLGRRLPDGEYRGYVVEFGKGTLYLIKIPDSIEVSFNEDEVKFIAKVQDVKHICGCDTKPIYFKIEKVPDFESKTLGLNAKNVKRLYIDIGGKDTIIYTSPFAQFLYKKLLFE